MPLSFIRKVVEGRHLTREEARAAAELLMEGAATSAQISALLVGLRAKGETVDEIAGFAESMRAHAIPVRPQRTPLLDTCGTGGSAFRVFNVSTCAAFVAAAAGIAVAKHGNRAMSGVCGSADVLEALGVRIDLTPEQVAACIDEVGIGFVFAQRHHPATRHVAATRREIGVRTIFNLLGPLTNPAGATRQSLGVYDSRLCELAAGALRDLGSERAIVAHAEIGMDEVSTVGVTRICELRDGELSSYTLDRGALGLPGGEPDMDGLAPARSVPENAAIVREVLAMRSGSPAWRARRDLVAVNAASALLAAGAAPDWPTAVRKATDVLETGRAACVLDNLVDYTQSCDQTAHGLQQ